MLYILHSALLISLSIWVHFTFRLCPSRRCTKHEVVTHTMLCSSALPGKTMTMKTMTMFLFLTMPAALDLTSLSPSFISQVRDVSNRILSTTDAGVESDHVYSYMITLFGQWNDHDLTFTPTSPSIRSFNDGIDCDLSCAQADPCFPIQIPPEDSRFGNNSKSCIPFFRSAPACGTGTTGHVFGKANIRQQVNALTAFLDAGQVYGSDDAQALSLRDLTNDFGLMRVNDRFTDNGREHLPFTNTLGTCSTRQKITNVSGVEEVPCFVAGDTRVIENIALSSIHTLFLREHNRLARALRQLNPHWSSETLYQEARKIVGGYPQVIVFRDYLKHIVGPDAMDHFLPAYPGYDENVDPSIANVFATAAYRFALLTLQPLVFRLNESYQEHPEFPSVPLHKAFFAPWRLIFEGGVDPLLRGLLGRPAKLATQDHMLVDAVREKLFQFTAKLALDLGSLNMQRGRDHGLPAYNAWRKFCGLSQPQNEEELAQVMDNPDLAKKIIELYGTPDNTDVWLGGVSEPFVSGGHVGPLFSCLIAMQFQKIRQGDRLWWEKNGVFTNQQRKSLAAVSLNRIICDNTGIRKVPKDPFLFHHQGTSYISCNDIPAFDLRPWFKIASIQNLLQLDPLAHMDFLLKATLCCRVHLNLLDHLDLLVLTTQ
uniref:Myeloid-specific peroxidase n=1 Tax=Scleropages formosus TaxID=113540 RepID=A0A8C9V4C0_SCLFO